MMRRGWKRAQIQNLGEVLAGRQRSPNQPGIPRPYLRVANVSDGFIDTSDVKEMPFTDVEFARFRLRPGDVLLNEGQSRELVGRSAVYRGDPPDCCFQNTIIRFRAGRDTDPEFAHQLFGWLRRAGRFAEIATQTTSIAHLGVNRFSQLTVDVPPFDEQQAIAATLKAVDDATAASEAVVEQLEGVRRDITEQLLRRGVPGHAHRLRPSELGQIPASWEVCRLGDLIEEGPTNGLYRPQEAYGSGVPIIRIDAFGNGDTVNTGHLRRLRITEVEARPFAVHAGDIVVNRVNSLSHLGKVGFVERVKELTVFESNMMRIQLNQRRCLPRYAFLVLASDLARAQILKRAKQAIAQASINQQDVKDMLVPLPPLDEQQTIVETLAAVRSRQAAEVAVLAERRRVKTALADVLLSGKIRVPHAGEEAEVTAGQV